MKIALIGGSGFIGTKLAADLLAQGHEIVIADPQKSEAYPAQHVSADLRDKDSLIAACQGCDVIYNLGAEHRDDVRPLSLYTDVNVTGSQNVCDAADALGITRMVFTSSVAIYGFPQGAPDENTPPNPFNEYGKTKAEAEEVYQAWIAAAPNDRSLTIVRPTAVFGPGNRGNVYNLMRQVAGGKFIMIGNGKNKKSLAYVDNVAAFLSYALGFGNGTHIYNYIDKPDYDMTALVSLIRQTLGMGTGAGLSLPYPAGIIAGTGFDILAAITKKNFPVSKIRVEKFCANTVFSSDKIGKETDFTPPVAMEDALRLTIAHEFAGPQSQQDEKKQAAS